MTFESLNPTDFDDPPPSETSDYAFTVIHLSVYLIDSEGTFMIPSR